MTAPDAPAPTGLKKKAGDAGLKLYLAAPPMAQTAMLNGFMKAQPVVAKAKPHASKLLAGTGAALVLRRLKSRGR